MNPWDNKNNSKFKIGEKYLTELEEDDEDQIFEFEIIKFSTSGNYMQLKFIDGDIKWYEVKEFEVLEKLE